MARYLRATDREDVAVAADGIASYLTGDAEVYSDPDRYFDEVIEIDLSALEPHLNGPFTPDLATPVSEMKEAAAKNSWPTSIEYGLIGSCTNSSYEDISRAASIARQAIDLGIESKGQLTITPGSELVRYTIERDGLTGIFKELGANVFANACGPCIGQWDREGADKKEKNSIVHSFNRNFSKRADGNPNTHAFVGSPELVTAIAIAGDLTFNPITDPLYTKGGKKVMLQEPVGEELPSKGFEVKDDGYIDPTQDGSDIIVKVKEGSNRLQLLEPFSAWDGGNLLGAKLLIKAKGKCTTDHISMAGPWLRFRGHLDNIANNTLTGAVNYFGEETNKVKNQIDGTFGEVPAVARAYKAAGILSVVVGDSNYGEGSSREHAAMQPRHLGVIAVIVNSFARIHETNLKKQGMLGLTFINENDYNLIQEDDTFNFVDLEDFAPGKPLTIEVIHSDGSMDVVMTNHTYNEQQINWFRAGSALNMIKVENAE
jgi:aconitate hydratase